MSDSMRTFGWYAAAGALLGIPFVVSALWFCGLLGVAVFVHATTLAKKPSVVLWGGFIAWTIKSLIALSWGWSIWPLDSFLFALPASGLWVIAFYWISGAVFLGVGGSFVAGWLWYFMVHKKFEMAALMALPFLWLLGEVLAAHIFSVMTVGPNGFYTAAFSYSQLGYILAEHNVLMLFAKIGGLYALTIIAVVTAALIFVGYKNFSGQKRLLFGVGVAVVLLGTAHIFSPSPAPTQGITIAIIDTNLDNQIIRTPEQNSEREALLGEAIDSALATESSYILLPEGANFNDANLSPEALARRMRFQTSDDSVVFIDSGRASTGSTKTALRATIYDGVSKEAWQVDKQYLVPNGEYVPTYFGALFSLLGMGENLMLVKKAFNYIPGPLSDQGVLPSGIPRVLFCFSSADPAAVRRLLADGAEVPFIAHPISHAWFGGSQMLKKQQTAMLRIQALWNDVAIVSAGNMTKGELYDKDGRVRIPVEVARGEGWAVSIIDL